MKRITSYLIIVVLAIGYLSSCKDMDSTYKEFIVPNGLVYIQRADSIKIFSGLNRVKIAWPKAKDPKVVGAKVYWNNYTDSILVDIPDDKDTITVSIDNLLENDYAFYIRQFDAKGNASIPTEITASTYGANYILGLVNRSITGALRIGDDGKINWANAATGLVFSEVRYKNSSGGTNTVRISATESSVVCPDIKRGEPFEYRSVFLPKRGIDSVALDWTTFEESFKIKFPKTGWTVSSRGGFHPWGEGGGGMPSLVVDNNLNTYWHSNVAVAAPHCLVIDMLETQYINHVVIFRHPIYRYASTVQIYLSDTEVTPDIYHESWGTPVAEDIFVGTNASLDLNLPINSAGRYMVVYFPNTLAPPYMNCAEVDVYGF